MSFTVYFLFISHAAGSHLLECTHLYKRGWVSRMLWTAYPSSCTRALRIRLSRYSLIKKALLAGRTTV